MNSFASVPPKSIFRGTEANHVNSFEFLVISGNDHFTIPTFRPAIKNLFRVNKGDTRMWSICSKLMRNTPPHPTSISLFKVKNRNAKKGVNIFSKARIKTPKTI